MNTFINDQSISNGAPYGNDWPADSVSCPYCGSADKEYKKSKKNKCKGCGKIFKTSDAGTVTMNTAPDEAFLT